jgi:hypothetical protein
MTWPIKDLPAISCNDLGMDEFILVPFPAAKIIDVILIFIILKRLINLKHFDVYLKSTLVSICN